jgi:anti-sigma B factor antagonist
MNAPVMNLDVRKVGTVGVIDLSGEITSAAETRLMEAFALATEEHPAQVLMNFGKLNFINSSGIGLLVTLLIRARRQQVRLMACGLSDHYRQIFELTRLNEAISIFATEEEALSAVNFAVG